MDGRDLREEGIGTRQVKMQTMPKTTTNSK
jgi:hypothetical protein